MQGASCHRLLCLSVIGRGSRGSLVHLSWLVVGGAGGVAAASAVVVVVAEDSMPMAEADTLPGEMRLLCSAIVDCKICHDSCAASGQRCSVKFHVC